MGGRVMPKRVRQNLLLRDAFATGGGFAETVPPPAVRVPV